MNGIQEVSGSIPLISTTSGRKSPEIDKISGLFLSVQNKIVFVEIVKNRLITNLLLTTEFSINPP